MYMYVGINIYFVLQSLVDMSGELPFPRGGGVPVPAPYQALAVSAGRGFDYGRLPVNALLAAALLRVVRDAVPVQAPALAFVVPSAAVRGFDAGVSGGLYACGAGRVRENAAACSVNVDFGAAAARSSAGGAAVCQGMNPGPSGVVLSSLVEGATVSSNHPRHHLCPTPLLPVPLPPHRHLRSLIAANLVSFNRIVSCLSY